MLKYISAFLLLPSILFGATVFVDPGTVESGATWDGVNGHSYSCAVGTGTGYTSLQAAIWGTNGTNPGADAGDTIYLRGGTYQEAYGTGTHPTAMEISTSLNGTAWTAGNYTTIASYPGEWAIIDGAPNDGAYLYSIAFGEMSWSSGAHPTTYIKFERLEITGGAAAGIGIKKGPVWVQYCYIHENGKDPHGIADNIQAGINAIRPTGCIIEYSYFYDNGNEATDGSTNSNHINLEADYLYTSYTFDYDNCNRDNEVRYNYFVGTGDTYGAVKNKAAQFLMARNNPTTEAPTSMTYKDHGNKMHHNIATGVSYLIFGPQDFAQNHNNIADGCAVAVEDGSTARQAFCVSSYNNTIIESFVKCTIGYAREETTLDLAWFCANNIISGYGSYDYSPSIGIAAMWQSASGDTCVYDYTWDNTIVDHNLIHNPQSASYHIGIPNSYRCKASRWITTSAFNTLRSTTNYTNATAGLFLGSSGANQYIADEDFAVATGVTIGDGGIGGNHPYLSGVTIPSYIGAVNPDDSGWVEDVLALATDGNSDGVPDNLLAGTEIDLDDGESTPAPPTISNVTISNGRVQ